MLLIKHWFEKIWEINQSNNKNVESSNSAYRNSNKYDRK
jgi:hypothetical protein